MSNSISVKKFTAIFLFMLAMIFTMTAVCTDIEAYAASVSKPAVTAVNTSPTSVKLSWKKVKGAKKYIIYRSNKKSKGYKAIKTLTKTSYTNKKLTCGKKYYYKVAAVKGSKKSNSKVLAVTAKPAKMSKPSAVSDCRSIKISWKKASSVSGYQVYSVTDKAVLTTTKSTSYTQNGLGLSSVKQYKIRAYKTVGKKKVYGSYSAAVTASTSSAHTAQGSWSIIKKATCSSKGSKVNTCSVCGTQMTEEIGIDPSKHSFVTNTVSPTCTAAGAVIVQCEYCSKVLSRTNTEATGHNYSSAYHVDKDGFRVYNCLNCSAVKREATCVIDLTSRTVSTAEAYPDLAVFSVSEKGNDKLDINPNGLFEFEIVGAAENLTIDVNADKDVDIKLAGVTVTNDSRDAFDIKKLADIDKTDADGNPVLDENGEKDTRVPEVTISAKDGTQNTVTVTTSGNAFDSECELSFKGHGALYIDTAATSITSSAKVNIKNLTMIINSQNRGIDTKTETIKTVTNPITGVVTQVTLTDYYNLKVGSDANITIESIDDCIRCKNMEITALNTANGEKDSIIVLNSSTGDGIQVEGGTGFTASSGDIKIKAAKYAFNCKEKKIIIGENVKLDTTGSANYCKPEI